METNISNEHNIVKNPNWQEADQFAIYKAWSRIWTRDYRETNPAGGKVEALNLTPSGLQHQRPKPLGHAGSGVQNYSGALVLRCKGLKAMYIVLSGSTCAFIPNLNNKQCYFSKDYIWKQSLNQYSSFTSNNFVKKNGQSV